MTGSVRGRQRRNVAACAGEQYDLYAYIRGELDADTTQGRFLIRAKFMDSNGASLGYSDITAMNPGAISSWTRVGGRVTAPANSVSMQVQYLLYQSSGWVNIDDVEVTIVPPNAATEVTKYYMFGSQRIAMRKNGVLTYLHADHLGSTVLETNITGTVTSDEKYLAYGKQRDSGKVVTDHRFTGQKEDASGLQYFNARFYDPVIGMFVSPDTIVPDALDVFAYNRLAYARLNPLRFNDPTGHDFWDVVNTVVDFASGVGAQVGYNNTSTFVPEEHNVYAPNEGESTSMVVGRHVGNLISTAQGAVEMVSGAGMMGGGVAVCATGVGCLATPAVEATGAAVATHGAVVAGNAIAEEAKALGNLVMAKMSGSSSGATNDRKSIEKSIRSLENRVAEHETKLADYTKDPYKYDNQGLLRNAPNDEIRQNIIQGRIQHLQQEIDNWRNQIHTLQETLSSLD